MLSWLKIALRVAYDRPMRCRVLGMRPVVICLIQSTENSDTFLFVNPSEKPAALMPPQEGIEPGESIEEAVVRGLETELGVVESQMHFRRSAWIGSKPIPEQKGERDVAYSLVKMRGKAYYAALVKISETAVPQPNSAEIAGWRWVSAAEVTEALESNSVRKQWVIQEAFRKLLAKELGGEK